MITIKNGRQNPLFAEVAFTYADLVTAVAALAAKLPSNSQVIGGALIVDTAWNTGTTAVADIGDSVDPDRYGADIDLKTAGRTALTLTGFVNAAGLDIAITPALAGTAATAGAGRLQVMYVIQDRATEVQPN